jgi:PAS domain S-box-containing protein
MKQAGPPLSKGRVLTLAIIIGLALVALALISRYNYLLFHTLAELVSIAVAWSLFILAWNTRRYTSDDGLLLMGIGVFLASLIDLVHTFAYAGMNLFPGYTADLPTQLWIAARYIQSLSLLAVSIRVQRPNRSVHRLTAPIALGTGIIFVALLLAAIFGGVFPDCYREGTGLTPFKRGSEILISLFLLVAIFFFRRARKRFDEQVLRFLLGAIVLMICSELSFIFYFHVYDLSNFIGHVFKIASFALLYFAIVRTGLEKPYALMFREIKQTEEVLRDSESRFRKIFEEGTFGIVIVNEEGRFLAANAAFCRMVGYTSEELSSMTFMDITHPDHIAQDSEKVRELREGAISVYRTEKRYRTKSGQVIWGDLTVSCVRDEQGKFLYFLSMIQDIT